MAQGCIPMFCELLTVADARTVLVGLEGLENILKCQAEIGAQYEDDFDDGMLAFFKKNN